MVWLVTWVGKDAQVGGRVVGGSWCGVVIEEAFWGKGGVFCDEDVV